MDTNITLDSRKRIYLRKLLSTKGLDEDRYYTVVRYLADNSKWKRPGVSQFTMTANFEEKACRMLKITPEELREAIDEFVGACLIIPAKTTYILNPEFFGIYDWKTVTDISYGISEAINFSHPYIGVRLEYASAIASC